MGLTVCFVATLSSAQQRGDAFIKDPGNRALTSATALTAPPQPPAPPAPPPVAFEKLTAHWSPNWK
eukprot:6963713-Prymnesium_polylepis.1